MWRFLIFWGKMIIKTLNFTIILRNIKIIVLIYLKFSQITQDLWLFLCVERPCRCDWLAPTFVAESCASPEMCWWVVTTANVITRKGRVNIFSYWHLTRCYKCTDKTNQQHEQGTLEQFVAANYRIIVRNWKKLIEYTLIYVFLISFKTN